MAAMTYGGNDTERQSGPDREVAANLLKNVRSI